MSWAICIAVLEIIGIYLLLTVVSSIWQQKMAVQSEGDNHGSTSISA